MRIGLRTKLLVIVLGIICVTSAAFAILSRMGTTKIINKLVSENIQSRAKNAAIRINAENEKEFNMLHALAAIDVFRDNNITLREKSLASVKVAKENPVKYEDCAFYAPNGDTYIISGKKINLANRTYVAEPVKGNDNVTSPAFTSVTNSVLMWYGVPVHDFDNKINGVLVSVIKGNRLSRIAAEIDIGGGWHPKIIDMATGKIIGDGNIDFSDNLKEIEMPTTNDELDAIMSKVLSGMTGSDIYIDPKTSEKMICSYQPVGGNCNWAVFCTTPYDRFFADLNKMNFTISIGLVFCIIFAVIVTMVLITIMIKPLLGAKKSMENSIKEIESGNADLTKKIEINSNDEIGDVVETFNKFTETLRSIVGDIQKSENDLNSAASGLSSVMTDTTTSVKNIMGDIEDADKQMENQTSSVSEVVRSIQEISSQIGNLDEMIVEQVNTVSVASSSIKEMILSIEQVNKSVENMVVAFENLSNDTRIGEEKQRMVNKNIQEIAEESEMLQEANKTISTIAKQTNLLAMNAAIEAAHAGTAGKGFSVVADEIRKLSETSSSQSKAIGDKLKKISDSIANVVQTSEESQAAFSCVFDKITHTGQFVEKIKSEMNVQLDNSKKIEGNLVDMNDGGTQVQKASEKMATELSTIQGEAKQLEIVMDLICKSIMKISGGAEKISQGSNVLSDISANVTDSIRMMSDHIGKFNV